MFKWPFLLRFIFAVRIYPVSRYARAAVVVVGGCYLHSFQLLLLLTPEANDFRFGTLGHIRKANKTSFRGIDVLNCGGSV